MKKLIFVLVCGLLLTPFNSVALYAEDFQLIGREKHISLFERWVRSSKGEQVRELKAVFTVHSDIPAIISILKDEQKSKQWNINAADFQIQKTKEKNCWVSYIRYDIPWPLNDQDCCLKYQISENNNSTLINFSSIIIQQFPVASDIDRITGVKGKWRLQKIDNDSIKIIYTITTDRSKKVPRWISDKIIHNNLYNTMAAFKNMAEQAF